MRTAHLRGELQERSRYSIADSLSEWETVRNEQQYRQVKWIFACNRAACLNCYWNGEDYGREKRNEKEKKRI